MPSPSKLGCTIVACFLIVVVVSQIVLFSIDDSGQPSSQVSTVSSLIHVTPVNQSSLSTVPALPRAASKEWGIVTPIWSPTAYATTNAEFQEDVRTIHASSGAQWLELPFLLHQATSFSTVTTSQGAPTVETLREGVLAAHQHGYRVFLVPLIGATHGPPWAGSFQLTSEQDQRAWFASYTSTLLPYVEMADTMHVDQLSIGTELEWMEEHADTTLWLALLHTVRAHYHGLLSYDSNWGATFRAPAASWLSSPLLDLVGVSAYFPPSAYPWKTSIQPILDRWSVQTHHKVLISEIGYRDTADAAVHSWAQQSSASIDATEQSILYTQALSTVTEDPHLLGIMCWGWQNVGQMQLVHQPVLSVFKTYFR